MRLRGDGIRQILPGQATISIESTESMGQVAPRAVLSPITLWQVSQAPREAWRHRWPRCNSIFRRTVVLRWCPGVGDPVPLKRITQGQHRPLWFPMRASFLNLWSRGFKKR